MIPHETVQKIYDSINIVEVVSDFVSLKRAGVNHKGLCPFHGEKTPSFIVSAAKGIYKCFGCGVGGDAVKFVMEHEKITYPESLKYIAKKYHIEIIEKKLTAEQLSKNSELASLSIISEHAKKFFVRTLHNTTEGRTIGLSYFKERGFSENIIKKFELGWSPTKRDILSRKAIKAGYKLKLLEKTGLTIVKKNTNYIFDRFSERVIFPIHSLSGKVLGFGGRTLRSDKKIAKYLNSPDSEIYHKSNVLYGIYFAKNSIVKKDKCFLTEGYTDVISMHMSGIENVVSSSGTSLTKEQIKLIRRFTKNLTVIYDGDHAGIKASLRGIDMILSEELNVKIVLLPEGEDPDSFSRSISNKDFIDYITKNEQDFIKFKTGLLLNEAKNDPIKRAGLVRNIVKSISVIPDVILRSEYIKECSAMLNVREETLYFALSRIMRGAKTKPISKSKNKLRQTPQLPAGLKGIYSEANEKEIIEYLLKYGKNIISFNDGTNEDDETVAEFIISQMKSDELEFINLVYVKIFEDFDLFLSKNEFPEIEYFIRHTDENIRSITTEIISPTKELSKLWTKRGGTIDMPENRLGETVPEAIERFKLKIVQIRINDINKEIKKLKPEEYDEKLIKLLNELKKLDQTKVLLINYVEKSALL